MDSVAGTALRAVRSLGKTAVVRGRARLRGWRRTALRAVAAVAVLISLAAGRPVLDAQDRAAFRAWFTLLADAQFYRPTDDVVDCAALVRHAAREALREHTPEWLRRFGLPLTLVLPDVRARLAATDGHLPIFRVDADEARHAEFADAATILRLNAVHVSRDAAAARPGDLLAFHQPGQRLPQHLMVFVGRSHFERDHDDWVVYHTGPDTAAGTPGEMRKVRLADLRRHPSPRWRPVAANAAFLGVYRLTIP
jgi:uncharacterized protein YfaT (DUF1175 family)